MLTFNHRDRLLAASYTELCDQFQMHYAMQDALAVRNEVAEGRDKTYLNQ